MLAYAWNSNTLEAEGGESSVWVQSGLSNRLQDKQKEEEQKDEEEERGGEGREGEKKERRKESNII